MSLDYVCPDCFTDEAIQNEIRKHAEKAQCDYCEATSDDDQAIAAPIEFVVDLIHEGVSTEWVDPVEELMWIGREGGYQGVTYDAWDLIGNIGLDIDNTDLFDVICGALSEHDWCQHDYALLPPGQARTSAWRDFKDYVKHKNRYMFLTELGEEDGFQHPDDIPPGRMLDEIGSAIRKTGLIEQLSTGTGFYRARVHGSDRHITTAKELGAPPSDSARYANRMSPAGIPMFYGATSADTALQEIQDPDRAGGHVATIGRFRTCRPLNVLRLVGDLYPPSIFDRGRRHLRPSLLFLCGFAADVSQPIKKDGREHIEYVPTQVFTEYMRHVFRTEAGEPMHGILYTSSRCDGGVCVVLFCSNADCTAQQDGLSGNEGKQWLEFEEGSITTQQL